MALTPKTPTPEATRDMEQQMLMREVDDAVRKDHAARIAQRYGIAIGGGLLLVLMVFGGYLFWNGRQEAAMEERSEQIVKAIDQLEAGNSTQAEQDLAALSEDGSPAARSVVAMLRAGIALEGSDPAGAVALYDSVANDEDAPAPMRDIANIRSVSAQFDNLQPQQVIDRLGPLAVADNPWFGSAGELVAMAYLAQGKEDSAGPLLVEIAKHEDVPGSLRARTRQLASLLGYDAIDDVEETLAEMRGSDLSADSAEQ